MGLLIRSAPTENLTYRTHPESLLVSAIINNIKDFEKGEIKKAAISADLNIQNTMVDDPVR